MVLRLKIKFCYVIMYYNFIITLLLCSLKTIANRFRKRKIKVSNISTYLLHYDYP